MIIISIFGGLGNQMFQYAAARRLSYIHKTPLFLDISRIRNKAFPIKAPRDFALEIFNVKILFASQKQISRCTGKYQTLFHNIFYKIGQKINRHQLIKEPHYHFYPELFNAPNNCYLSGYWQSEKYFFDIEHIIRDEFSFKNNLTSIYVPVIEKIVATNSVCIHIRRTDFVTNPNVHLHNLDYFFRAVSIINQKISQPHFFIFSDDIDWCTQNVKLSHPTTFVPKVLSGENAQGHLHLMTLCKHFILSNSTFGWWAAWLQPSKDKIVITPRNWFGISKLDSKDLIPESWLKI